MIHVLFRLTVRLVDESLTQMSSSGVLGAHSSLIKLRTCKLEHDIFLSQWTSLKYRYMRVPPPPHCIFPLRVYLLEEPEQPSNNKLFPEA